MWLVLPLPLHLVIIVKKLACPADSLFVGGPAVALSPVLPPQNHQGGRGLLFGASLIERRLERCMSLPGQGFLVHS
jgi:hypothetical protein